MSGDACRGRGGALAAQKARVENAGVLAASGLIAGEALVGLFIAAVVGLRAEHKFWHASGFESLVPWMAIPVLAFLVWYLIAVPLRKAGEAVGPAPAQAAS